MLSCTQQVSVFSHKPFWAVILCFHSYFCWPFLGNENIFFKILISLVIDTLESELRDCLALLEQFGRCLNEWMMKPEPGARWFNHSLVWEHELCSLGFCVGIEQTQPCLSCSSLHPAGISCCPLGAVLYQSRESWSCCRSLWQGWEVFPEHLAGSLGWFVTLWVHIPSNPAEGAVADLEWSEEIAVWDFRVVYMHFTVFQIELPNRVGTAATQFFLLPPL